MHLEMKFNSSWFLYILNFKIYAAITEHVDLHPYKIQLQVCWYRRAYVFMHVNL